jgi:uncharacterized Zn finger protein (UPF0148 family)|nr:MAG TPA: zinc-ribbon domain protein [Caudoviricetes sp.]
MKNKNVMTRKCPKCNEMYCGVSVLSRIDNTTLICPDCGTREALESIGIGEEEQNEIVEIIHRSIDGTHI